jgi:ribosomal protein L37AE/L43A
MADPDPADTYALWCSLNPCPACDGIGEDDEDVGLWTCGHCGGTGIDPNATYDGPPPI